MKDSIREALAGAAAGASARTLVAPLDRLKLVVQLQGSIDPTRSKHQGSADAYKGPKQALAKILREEGFFALWRGNAPTIIIQGGTSALNFLFLDLYKKAATCLVGQNGDHRLLKSFVSGFLAGGTAITILFPVGLMRTKLALDVGRDNRRYPRGMRDVVLQTYQVNGIPGL